MRRAPAGRTHHIARFPFEFVRQPIDPVRAPFDFNFAAVLRHYAEKSVAVRDPEWFNAFVNECERARPSRFRFECGKDEPPIQRQHHNDHPNRAVDRQSILSPCRCAKRARLAQRGGYSVINQQQAKRDREQIEETVIAGDSDDDLQKNEQTGTR